VRIPEFSHDTVAGIVADIHRRGFAVYADFLAPDDLASARRFVAEAVEKNAGEYIAFTGPDDVSSSGLDELGRSQVLHRMLEQIYEHETGESAPEQDLYQVLRCLCGKTATPHSYYFHYDSYVVAVLIPIDIPTEGQSGDFLLLPCMRRIPKIRFWDVLEKSLIEIPLSQWALRRLAIRGSFFKRVSLVPGNAYFFFGGRAIHTNAPCDQDRVRATALFHFGRPFTGTVADFRFRRKSAVPQ
jgi:hypothetical protein